MQVFWWHKFLETSICRGLIYKRQSKMWYCKRQVFLLHHALLTQVQCNYCGCYYMSLSLEFHQKRSFGVIVELKQNKEEDDYIMLTSHCKISQSLTGLLSCVGCVRWIIARTYRQRLTIPVQRVRIRLRACNRWHSDVFDFFRRSSAFSGHLSLSVAECIINR